MVNCVFEWLRAGCDPVEGLSLLRRAGGSPFLIRFAASNPDKNRQLIIDTLCQLVGVSPDDAFKKEEPETAPAQEEVKVKVEAKSGTRTVRDVYPFLNQTDCPMELKALVTDKFSTFYQYRDLHKQLFDCTNLDECAEVSRDLLDNYLENRMIFAELDYFQSTKTILGKHPIFAHRKQLDGLRKMSEKNLYQKKKRLEHNIWRIQDDIKKGFKPHLDTERRLRLETRMVELDAVKGLLGEDN
jgi:hypothetical protein